MGIVVIAIILLFAFFALKGYMKGKINQTYWRFKEAENATAQSMLDGNIQYPSWINQNRLANQLGVEIIQYAIKGGITTEAAAELFARPSVRGSAATMAANLEKRGFSVSEQIAGAAQFAEKVVDIEIKNLSKKETKSDVVTTHQMVDDKQEGGLDVLLGMIYQAVDSDGLIQRGPVAFRDIERLFELYGCYVPAMWATEDGFRAGGGLVEFRTQGKCLVYTALTSSHTFVMAHRDHLPEITPDIKSDVIALFQNGFSQWVESVPNYSERATELS